jgi:aldose 1-epimerase
MYKIEQVPFGEFTKIKLINSASGEFVSIVPEFGANVNEIALISGGGVFSLLDSDKTYKELMKNEWYRGAKMVPFPNRVENGKYEFERKKYELPINYEHHAIHGIVYNKNFRMIEKKASSKEAFVLLEYKYNGDLGGYPFPFTIQIRYSLSKNGFRANTIITNTGKLTAPIGDGWHPYFSFGEKVDGLSIKLPSNKKIEVKELIPTGKYSTIKDFVSLQKIKATNFNLGLVMRKRKKATTTIFSPKNNFSLNVWQSASYPYLQVFTPPGRASIAIEPMSCNANAFNNKKGLVSLAPKKSFKGSYGVYLS